MGIQLALLITLRFNLILSLTRLLLIDMNESLLLQALRRLPLPENYFISLFSLFAIFQCSVKYIKRWIWQCEHVATSQKLNGRTLFITAQRVALLLIHALVKAEKTEMALKARGFQLNDIKKTQDKS